MCFLGRFQCFKCVVAFFIVRRCVLLFQTCQLSHPLPSSSESPLPTKVLQLTSILSSFSLALVMRSRIVGITAFVSSRALRCHENGNVSQIMVPLVPLLCWVLCRRASIPKFRCVQALPRRTYLLLQLELLIAFAVTCANLLHSRDAGLLLLLLLVVRYLFL